jgi:UDP-3-O-[3-hydroxymyristoyl] glucosamine N-acyltransferase
VTEATTTQQLSEGPGNSRFFLCAGPIGLAEIARLIGADLPPAHADMTIARISPLQIAGPGELSFLDNRKYVAALEQTRAGAVIVHPGMLGRVPAGCAALAVKEPYLAWAKVAALFHPAPAPRPGIHPSAVVDPSAEIDPSCEIGPGAVIGAKASIGANCIVGPHCVIGQGVTIGADSRIGAHCTISHAVLGQRVGLLPGARIGQEGFGFATTMTPTGPRHVSVPQLGIVRIEDDVEIGANTAIDRGSAQDTVIGAGTRIDNLVQIGHNVQIGRGCVIVSQVGISGSTVLEDFVVLAGQVGIAGHVRIGRGARLAGQTGVMSDLEGGKDYAGSPAMPAKDHFRQVAVLKRLAARKPATGETDRN